MKIDDRKAVVAGVGWSSEAGPDQPFQAQSEYSLAATRTSPEKVSFWSVGWSAKTGALLETDDGPRSSDVVGHSCVIVAAQESQVP